jgi:two-component system nitrogen regulation response regulator GlnG
LPEFLPESLRREPHPIPLATEPAAAGDKSLDLGGLIDDLLAKGDKELHGQVVRAVERLLLERVLRHTHGHQAQASELLGLNRATLRHKLRSLGLAVDKVLSDDRRGESGAGKEP